MYKNNNLGSDKLGISSCLAELLKDWTLNLYEDNDKILVMNEVGIYFFMNESVLNK